MNDLPPEYLSAVWQVLQEWMNRTQDGRNVLVRFAASPREERANLLIWLQRHLSETPPQIATHVAGGRVDYLVNIAELAALHVHEADPAIPTIEYIVTRTRRIPSNKLRPLSLTIVVVGFVLGPILSISSLFVLKNHAAPYANLSYVGTLLFLLGVVLLVISIELRRRRFMRLPLKLISFNLTMDDQGSVWITKYQGRCPICGSDVHLQDLPRHSDFDVMGICDRQPQHSFTFDYTTNIGVFQPMAWRQVIRQG